MSSSPPPTKKFFLKPSALKVPSSSLGVVATETKDELAKEESTKTVINTPTEESDVSKGSLLRPSALKVQTQTPQEIKPVENPAIDSGKISSKISFPPLTPPEETGDKSKTSPEPQNDNTDNGKQQVITNGHKASSFVFGERLEDRVTITEQSSSANPTKVVDLSSKPKNVSPGQEVKTDNQESGSKKRPFEVLTGEEGEFVNSSNFKLLLTVFCTDESNVLQIHCKLYQWETSDAVWREKGNGSLKLNDRIKDGKLCSRLGKG